MKKIVKYILIIIFVVLVILGIFFFHFRNKIYNSFKNIEVDYEIKKLDNGLSVVKFDDDYGFNTFLNNGGASSDMEVVRFLTNQISNGYNVSSWTDNNYGCSTIQVQNKKGDYLFGRNFDWYKNDAMIIISKPKNAYASISTVNTNFITSLAPIPENALVLASMYAPLDGMNEKGLTISVNYIEDNEAVHQNTNKPDITTTTAIRLLLNKASNVDEAISLLEQYDMNSSMNWVTHFAITDLDGKAVAVEYIDNKMIVTETKILTNFYVTKGNKYGIGTEQSHTRFETLENILREKKTLEMDDVRDALESVSKKHFNDGETTEWSIVFNQNTGDVHYYHRENFDKRYTFNLND